MLTRKQMERDWLRPGVRDPRGAPSCIRPSQELRAKIRRECPRNAKQILAAFGRHRTRYDAPPDVFDPTTGEWNRRRPPVR